MSTRLDRDGIQTVLRRPVGRWRQVDVHDSIDSTNAESERDPLPWRVVAAGEQTAGRGRHARSWSSPPGTSVSLSLTLPLPSGVDGGWFPLVVGLAVRDALVQLCGDTAQIALKWPNDVLGGPQAHKVCGILCHLLPGGLVLAGIGVNVGRDDLITAAARTGSAAKAAKSAPDSAPDSALSSPAPTPPTTLADLVSDSATQLPTREQVVISVAEAVLRRHEQWSGVGERAIRADYRSACATIGREVRVHLPGDIALDGVAEDIDDTGRLLVRAPDGGRHTFAAGDVVHIRPVDQA